MDRRDFVFALGAVALADPMKLFGEEGWDVRKFVYDGINIEIHRSKSYRLVNIPVETPFNFYSAGIPHHKHGWCRVHSVKQWLDGKRISDYEVYLPIEGVTTVKEGRWEGRPYTLR